MNIIKNDDRSHLIVIDSLTGSMNQSIVDEIGKSEQH